MLHYCMFVVAYRRLSKFIIISQTDILTLTESSGQAWATFASHGTISSYSMK